MVERYYAAFMRDIITNEIFRRVEPMGRTLGEYIHDFFPEMDIHLGIKDPKILNRT